MITDSRIPQVKKILSSILSPVHLSESEVLITENNFVIAVLYNTIIYSIELINELPGRIIGFKYKDIEYLENDQCIYDEEVTFRLYNTIAKYFSKENQNNLLSYSVNLESDESFSSFKNMKAGDNLKFYKMSGNTPENTYFVPIFSGFPSLNKDDKLNIFVYDMNNGIHFLNVMDIYKKKIKRNIKIYFVTIDINK